MREPIQTDQAPRAIGPYSQAIRAGGLVFTSGQLGLDPATGKLREGGVKAQARQCMENAHAILKAAGSDFSKVVKATLFLADIQDFGAVNEVYGGYFPSDPPARSAFQVAALPMGALVEIEMIGLA
ncbi:MAG: RidA family protein [Deltaproteobacteria bacterium]|nr:RidA family protein [Deltaproteobacteria bacterium]MCF8118856.1 RidA family protein [Deltaproteobacteria bacterium]